MTSMTVTSRFDQVFKYIVDGHNAAIGSCATGSLDGVKTIRQGKCAGNIDVGGIQLVRT